MCSFNECLIFAHSIYNVNGEIRINVIIVFNGIRRASTSFYNIWIIGSNAGRCALPAMIACSAALDW